MAQILMNQMKSLFILQIALSFCLFFTISFFAQDAAQQLFRIVGGIWLVQRSRIGRRFWEMQSVR